MEATECSFVSWPFATIDRAENLLEEGYEEEFKPFNTNRRRNKYFELKNSWGAGAPLNSNYLLAISPYIRSSL